MDSEISKSIQNQFGRKIISRRRLSGGDAARAWQVEFNDGDRGFLKTVSAGGPFQMEALGLERLQCDEGVRVPKVLAVGARFLLLEWLELGSPPSDFQIRMGHALARTHLNCRGTRYGFDENHFIGVTPQRNLPWVEPVSGAWAEFWWTHRLEPMLIRLKEKSLLRSGIRLSDRLGDLLPDPEGAPSLLHGDLWSGNAGADSQGQPVMFDPAPFYGHPEAELGMTRMFGGFTGTFYDAYDEVFPLQSGWRERLDLTMLYHVLNHACIFGGDYVRQAASLFEKYL